MLGQFDPMELSASLLAFFPAGVLDQDASYRLRGGGEEVPAATPVLGLLGIDKAEVGFVNQGRGLERLAGLLLSYPLGSEPAQFVVDQRQQLLGGVRVAGLDGGQDTRDLGHSGQSTARGTARLARRRPEACALRSFRRMALA